ncbi:MULTISPECIES: hypothetical protein [unclassified Kitasatospora]|uniref:hypothetical protein n=1 Tax=unclassified Kitasatospora TaxID=2633591 RepID=UPI002F909D88
MRFHGRTASAAVVISGALLGALASAAPAQASGAWNEWGLGSYHAGLDGTAGSSDVTLGGFACGGWSARLFYVQLVRSDGTKIRSTKSWAADGTYQYQTFYGATSPGTTYYVRWYGQDSNENNGFPAKCSGAGFDS